MKRNQEMAKAFRQIAEGLTTLANAYEMEEVVSSTTVEDEPLKEEIDVTHSPVEDEVDIKEVGPQVEEKEETPYKGYTEEELASKTYNEIKSIAKELGVKAVGTKNLIINSILDHLGATSTVDTENVEEVTEDEEYEEVVDTETDEEEGTEVELDEDEPTFYDTVAKDLEGYSDEELADILSSTGISPRGKRQALVAKIVQAIEDGKLEWDSEEEEEEVVEEPKESKELPTTKDKEEVVESKTRKLAKLKMRKELLAEIKNGEVSHKEILKFLKDFYNGRFTSKGEENDINEYVEIHQDLIDDEGVLHELADPYYVGDDVFCCGQNLENVDEDLYCEICGTTYTM